MGKTLGDAFGGKLTTLEEQRAIWAEAVHEDAIWEGPMFERPVQVIGREATSRFFELLLSVVPQFSTTVVGYYPTSDPDTSIIESFGGGPTRAGGEYTQRYFSIITMKDGLAFRMREPPSRPTRRSARRGRDGGDSARLQPPLARLPVPRPHHPPARARSRGVGTALRA